MPISFNVAIVLSEAIIFRERVCVGAGIGFYFRIFCMYVSDALQNIERKFKAFSLAFVKRLKIGSSKGDREKTGRERE